MNHINNVWTDRNTTVVGGYLKTASPIIKIWNDGKFETNDESEGATVERLSEGIYLIKNVLGFNADAAWGGVDGGVEIPMCKNKLPLIWVD
ncbi:phage tail protein, partial [Xenorhabdus sp. XENO-10]|nr:phage tail protein [Xenorhabdus yunnanensis]